MIVTTKTLFAHAYGKYAVGAYNINNAEQAMGLFKGNLDAQSPLSSSRFQQGRALLHRQADARSHDSRLRRDLP